MLVVAMLPPLSPVSMFVMPSIVMLLELGRWPLTVNALTCAFSTPATLLVSTPGTRFAKLNRARPLFAMFLSVSFSIVYERSPLSTCSSLTRADTLTLSAMPPTSRAMLPAESRSFAFTTRLVRSMVLKPCILTWRV